MEEKEKKEQELSQSAIVPPQQAAPRNIWKYIAFILVAVILISLVSGGFFLATQKKTGISQTLVPTKAPVQTQTSVNNTSSALFTGALKPIADQGLFVETQNDKDNEKLGNAPFSVNYYEAGTYISGPHAGFKRIIAIVHSTSVMGGYYIVIFATEDNKNFIMNPTTSFYDDSNLAKSKITKTEKLETEHTDQINLDSHFALNKIDFATQFDKDYKVSIITDFSAFKSLSSSNPNLKYYARPADLSNTSSYIAGKTEIVVVDETGLAYFYNLTTVDAASVYEPKNQTYQKYLLNKNPNPPEYPLPPDLQVSASDITLIQTGVPLYKIYNSAFPQACSGTEYTSIIKNVADSELTKIGSTKNFDVYIISNKNNPIYQDEFKIKIYKDGFKEVNKMDPPTFDQYLTSYPLIFAKDPFGRLFALGEFDYKLLGGCGKPVLYFYPQKETEVAVSFADNLRLDLSIPNYSNGWNILAFPDGSLKDLQPNLTDCSKIDTTKTGSEYAGVACGENKYPYLYWAGQNLYKPYPIINGGWIVGRSELSSFMGSKLTQVGFNLKEKEDMLSYWVPQMLSKNKPYYRISFLQTEQMNSFIPMIITPMPDRYYRLFLDYEAFDQKPSFSITPQILEKIERVGFTVVEWGGLKK